MEISSTTDPKPALAPIRTRVLAERTKLRESFIGHVQVGRYLRSHSKLVDSVLRELWLGASLPPDAALLAVGGYEIGRASCRERV